MDSKAKENVAIMNSVQFLFQLVYHTSECVTFKVGHAAEWEIYCEGYSLEYGFIMQLRSSIFNLYGNGKWQFIEGYVYLMSQNWIDLCSPLATSDTIGNTNPINVFYWIGGAKGKLKRKSLHGLLVDTRQ